MTDKSFRLRKLKLQLETMRASGKHYVCWKLSREQRDFLSQYFEIKPYLYVITTKEIKTVKFTKSKLIKEIHHMYKRGKRSIVKPLSEKEEEVLCQYDVLHRVLKYKIMISA